MRIVSLRTACMFAVLFVVVTPLLWAKHAYSAQLLNRSVTVADPRPSQNTSHTFNFSLQTVGTIGSLQFEYCSNSPVITTPCVAPTGLDVSAAVISSQTGETGFSVDAATTANNLILTRAPAANVAIPVSYVFSNVINQSTPNSTAFVRITSYPTTDASGAFTDDGSVAYSTTSALSVSGFVPPYLVFCVGVTVAGDCSSANGQLLNLGELKPNQPSFATSQFAGATNDPGGYSTFVNGLTMTSGSNVIPALNTPLPSQTGTSQFGMNLRSNSNPSVGSNPSGVGTSTPTSDYNQPNLYVFKNQIVTSSPISTDYNLFTASYVVNVSPNQPAGIYNTTLTYIATAAF